MKNPNPFWQERFVRLMADFLLGCAVDKDPESIEDVCAALLAARMQIAPDHLDDVLERIAVKAQETESEVLLAITPTVS